MRGAIVVLLLTTGLTGCLSQGAPQAAEEGPPVLTYRVSDGNTTTYNRWTIDPSANRTVLGADLLALDVVDAVLYEGFFTPDSPISGARRAHELWIDAASGREVGRAGTSSVETEDRGLVEFHTMRWTARVHSVFAYGSLNLANLTVDNDSAWFDAHYGRVTFHAEANGTHVRLTPTHPIPIYVLPCSVLSNPTIVDVERRLVTSCTDDEGYTHELVSVQGSDIHALFSSYADALVSGLEPIAALEPWDGVLLPGARDDTSIEVWYDEAHDAAQELSPEARDFLAEHPEARLTHARPGASYTTGTDAAGYRTEAVTIRYSASEDTHLEVLVERTRGLGANEPTPPVFRVVSTGPPGELDVRWKGDPPMPETVLPVGAMVDAAGRVAGGLSDANHRPIFSGFDPLTLSGFQTRVSVLDRAACAGVAACERSVTLLFDAEAGVVTSATVPVALGDPFRLS